MRIRRSMLVMSAVGALALTGVACGDADDGDAGDTAELDEGGAEDEMMEGDDGTMEGEDEMMEEGEEGGE